MLTHLRSEFCSRQFDSRLLALAKPVALAADGRDVRVMQQPIEHRSCHGRIAGESRIPTGANGRLLVMMTEPCSYR